MSRALRRSIGPVTEALYPQVVWTKTGAATAGTIASGVHVGVFPATSVLDDFNRANTGPPPSGSWAGPIFPFFPGLTVVSNQVQGDAGTGQAYWNTSFAAGQQAFATVKSTPAANYFYSFYGRIAQPGTTTLNAYQITFYAQITGVSTAYHVTINRWDSSTSHTVLLDAVGVQLAANDVIGMDIRGNTITAYRNGAVVLQTTDSTYQTAGYIGLEIKPGDLLDDFGGGATPGAVYAKTGTITAGTVAVGPEIHGSSKIKQGVAAVGMLRVLSVSPLAPLAQQAAHGTVAVGDSAKSKPRANTVTAGTAATGLSSWSGPTRYSKDGVATAGATASGDQETTAQTVFDAFISNQILYGAIVSAQLSPNSTVTVTRGANTYQNQPVSFVAQTLTIQPADATYDRIDYVTVDSGGNLQVESGPVREGGVYPPTTTNIPVAQIYVVSQSSPSYTGAIVTDAITDLRPLRDVADRVYFADPTGDLHRYVDLREHSGAGAAPTPPDFLINSF